MLEDGANARQEWLRELGQGKTLGSMVILFVAKSCVFRGRVPLPLV